MKLISKRSLGVVTALALVLIAGCASKPKTAVTYKHAGTGVSGPGQYNRPSSDGAPWWDVNVDNIPDAVPMPHNGAYKANPYTVLGKTYYPIQDGRKYREEGTASWYGTKFHHQDTANGEKYDLYGMSAAHKTLPLPTYVKVTNLENGRSVVLRVNDRGPFYSDRVIDLSFAAAKKLGYAERGTARVRVEGIDPVQWWADRGQPVPTGVIAGVPSRPATIQPQVVEQYTPPPQQHAAAVVPTEMNSSAGGAAGNGVFLQVGAFANPDAAELLRAKLSSTVSTPVFVSSVVRNNQMLHRVRLGPIANGAEATAVEEHVRLANLGQPRRVTLD